MEQQIREALDKASTQHEWDSDGRFIQWKDGHPLKGTYRQIAITHAHVAEVFINENHENDAHLIVNTPAYLEWCLSQLSTIQQQNKQMKEALERIHQQAQYGDSHQTGWKVAEWSSEALQSIQGGTHNDS